MAALIKTSNNLLREALNRYKRYFDVHCHRTNDKVDPCDSVFFKTTLADQSHKLAAIATGLFLVAVVDPHTVTVQRPANSIERISRNCIWKTSTPQESDNHDTKPQLHDHSRILDLPNRRRSHVFAPRGATTKEGDTGRESAKFDDFATSLRDIEHFRSRDRDTFSKQQQ